MKLDEIIRKHLNKVVKENDRTENYMFFSNLQQIHRQCEMLMKMNPQELDQIIQNGHDWADDHVSEAKNNMDQVFDFFMNETKRKDNEDVTADVDSFSMNEEKQLDEKCWDGYKRIGSKKKNGKTVPNCVPVSEDMDSDDDVNYGLVEPEEYDVEDEDMEDFISFMRAYSKDLSEATCPCMHEAEYQGREVKLGKPMAGDVKKFKVYVKNPAGNVVKVNFGQKGMKIRKSNPAARKSFRARMNCDNPGPRHKANYWSCRKW